MANKYDQPPAYNASSPQPPQPAYHNYPPQSSSPYGQPAYGSPGPHGPGPYGPPGQGIYYPTSQPGMGYHPQQQPAYGPQAGYYQQQPQGYYRDDRRGGPGFMEACLASLACCCCLDCLLF